MSVYAEEYRHPTQASLVRLSLFEEPDGHSLVTESRSGPSTVIATLGAYESREEALARIRQRGEELGRQRYELVGS
ncbi:MAG TPA: hypothetical protein VN083_02150 [Vicinamibacteria bacterium]|jgi:hypothetical protein|nr:hypothetical protein [Vicinamibacteria bacterium]